MHLDLWRHEITRAGPALLAGVLGLVAVGLLAGVLPQPIRGRLVTAGVEVVLPLAAAVGAASLAGRDRPVELLLSLPTSYRAILLRRLTITVAWAILLAAACGGLAAYAGWWAPQHPAMLVWLAPLLWLPALGALLGVLAGSTAGSLVVAGVWVLEQLAAGALVAHPVTRALLLFPSTWQPQLPDWWTNRMTLLTTAGLLLVVLWPLLARPHRLLAREDR